MFDIMEKQKRGTKIPLIPFKRDKQLTREKGSVATYKTHLI